MERVVLVCVAAYLAGSINFSILFFRIAGKADPRLSFSGNAGTTNVYRQAGLPWAVLVFALDIGRALAVACLAVHYINGEWLVWAGFFLILGNTFPCFHSFRGGKGVANYLGFTILIAPWAVMLSAMIWACVFWLKRMPFLASLFMVATLSVGHGVTFQWALPTAAGAFMTFALIVLNHRKNILDALRQEDASASQHRI